MFIGTHSEYDKIKDIKKYIGYGYQGRKRVQRLRSPHGKTD